MKSFLNMNIKSFFFFFNMYLYESSVPVSNPNIKIKDATIGNDVFFDPK